MLEAIQRGKGKNPSVAGKKRNFKQYLSIQLVCREKTFFE